MSLVDCIKKIALSKTDREAINSIASELVQDGMTEEEALTAENQAVEQYLSSIDTDLDEIATRAQEAGATVSTVSEPEIFHQEKDAVTFNELGLYSAVEQSVIDAKIQSWTPSKKNPEGSALGSDIFAKIKSTPGVKKEELFWTGIEEALTLDPEARFTREQVLEFVRKNGVVVEEVMSDEKATDESLSFDEGKVWDDPEAWQHDLEDALYDFDHDSSDTQYIYDVEEWMAEWIGQNQQQTLDYYRPSMSSEELIEIDAIEGLDDKIDYLREQAYEPEIEMRSKARDDFEMASDERAKEGYMENPIKIYSATNEGVDLFIFGNDDTGYSVREGSWELHQNTVSEGEIYSLSEAEIQAQDYAYSNDIMRASEEGDVTKWEEYVMDGEYENYREFKIILPDLDEFSYDVHFDEENIVSFMRVEDRELEGVNGVSFHIDELQSDWHQKGRQVGYRDMSESELEDFKESLLNERETMEENSYDVSEKIRDIALEEAASIGEEFISENYPYLSDALKATPGSLDFTFKYDEEIKSFIEKNGSDELKGVAEEYELLLSDIKEKNDQINNLDEMVPDAPFKGDSWINMILKRAIIKAVEDGNDSLSWSNASVLGERWSNNYLELYTTLYNKKMPSLIKKLTGETPAHLAFNGDPVEIKTKPSKYDSIKIEDEYGKPGKYTIRISRNGISPYIYKDPKTNSAKIFDSREEAMSAGDKIYERIPVETSQGTFSIPITDKLKEKVKSAGYPLFQKDEDIRGSIQLMDDGAIIKLHKASDLSSFLHESAHLFLNFEKVLSKDGELTKDQQTVLNFLEVDSFDDIDVEHHEKFAETFEVYLREGKAPSLALRDAFSAFKEWLLRIYQTLTDPRLGRAKLNPDITEVFDRLLATEAEIEQARSNPAYDQFFKSKEQAGMTNEEWEDYKSRVEKAKNRSQESIDTKLLKELYRRKTREWGEEKRPLIEKEMERLAEEPVYKIRDSIKKYPMDRDSTKEVIGLPPALTAAERIVKGETILPTDSLLVAAARKGGLNMEIWSMEGVDPEYMKDRAFNNQVFGHPIFRKNDGLTPDDLAEIANESGYGLDLSANDALDLVFKELGGEPVYTPEGYSLEAEAEYRDRFEEDITEKSTPAERFINRSTKKGGVDPQEYSDFYNYPSSDIMINELIDAPTLKRAASDSAEQIMVDKYGDILNDGSIDAEIRESIHNEAQAALLLSELRALKPKATRINSSYLKAEAKKLISTMKYSEIKPNKYYRAEINAAKKSVEDPDNAYQHKIQQLANHYMYKEAVFVREQMVKQRRYVRRLQDQKYPPRTVESSYAQNIRMLARAYNMKQGNARKVIDVERVISWMITQIEDENSFINFDIYDPSLIKIIQDRQMGLPVDYTLPEFSDLTAGELKGLYNQLRHMRFIGGKASESQRNELNVSRETAAISIKKQSRKQVPFTHDISNAERRKDNFLEFGYSHRRIGGIFETLDGFEEDLPMSNEYEQINKAADKSLELTNDIAKSMDEAFKGVLKLINRRKTTTVFKEDGMEFTLNHRARFVLGLNWGNEGNKKAVLDGLNNKSMQQYTERDIVKMLSTMSTTELEALNKIWAAKEPLWPQMSGVEVRLKGVAPAKVEATPFEINGIKLTGGHYRIHYRPDPNDSARSELATDKPGGDKIKLYTASSLNERVGSGGRQVDLDLSHLFSDIQEDIHYIANAELATHLNSMFKGVNNPVVENIISGYGNVYYKNLIQTLSSITQKEDPASGLWKYLKIVRTNLTYAYLAFSVRNVIQQPIAITNSIAQLGEKYVMKGMLEFYRSPVANWEKISKASPFMRNRTSLVNREAREQLTKTDALHPALGEMKNLAFMPQTFMDSLIAYPTWMGALSRYKAEHPTASEAKAKRYADEMVAKTIGSGLSKDVGSILNKGEAEKQITFMGTFFNLTWNLHVENAQLLKRKKISGMEYARRLGWMAIAPALLAQWILDDVPEDDDELLEHSLKEIAFYNMSSLFLVRDLASGIDGFTPSIPGLKWIEGVIKVEKGMEGLLTGDEEFDAEQLSKIIRGLQPLVPLPGSGQIARTLEGLSDPEQDIYGALVEGKERNK